MSPPRLKPTPAELERFRVRLARDQESPSGLCWRDRPPSLFKRESDWASWTAKWVWKPAGTLQDGVWRIAIDGAKGRKFKAQDIVAALEAMGDDTLRSDAGAAAEASGGTLADVLEDARRGTGMTLGDLTVLSAGNDPYRCATPKIKRDAEWTAARFAETEAPHLRGFHYKLIGRAKKPNGATYSGSNKDWRWLKRATAAARWLGLIPFDALEDRRNGEPVVYRAERSETVLAVGAAANFDAEPPTIDITDGETGEISIFPTLSGMAAEQKFVIAIFGEKSSIKEEAEPVAIETGADLYLETGEQSITHVYHIAKRAAADGRHLIVAAVTDCDPAGYQMAVSIARKLQALRDLEFPDLDFDVIHIGLTPDQVRHFRLPESPLKDTEKRKARWKERMGVEQTEIDALLVLYPGALGQMIRDALKHYFDPTLAVRVREAEREWRVEARAAIDDQINDDPDLAASWEGVEAHAQAVSERIEALNTKAEQLREIADEINAESESINAEITDINEELASLTAEIDLDPPGIPEAELPEQPTNGPSMVLSSAWSWVTATQRLKSRKAYENDDDDETEEEESEDD